MNNAAVTGRIKISLEDLKSKAVVAFEDVFRQRAQDRESLIKQEVGNYLKQIFDGTEVAISLRGQGSTDLAAELGLSNAQAAGLAEGMGDILAGSVRVPPLGGGSVIMRVEACRDDWTAYLGLPGATVISQNAVVPVMQWMLMNPKVDIGEAAYDIVYEGAGGGQWDAYIQERSRSGRALMGVLGALKDRGIAFRPGGYVLPEILLGHAGKNFIQYAVAQPGVAEQTLRIAKQIVGA